MLTREQIRNSLVPQNPATTTIPQPIFCDKLTLITELIFIQQEHLIISEKPLASNTLGTKKHQFAYTYSTDNIFIVENITTRQVHNLKLIKKPFRNCQLILFHPEI